MSIPNAFSSGFRRVLRYPALIFWVYLASVTLALPLAASMRAVLNQSIGDSLVHQNLRQSFDLDWYGEFSSDSSGLRASFGPQVVGILPVLANVEAFLDGTVLKADATILAAGVLFLLAWAFLGGGIIELYRQPDGRYSRSHVFSQAAAYFFRFTRLLIIALLLYGATIRWVARPLHAWVEHATRDSIVESTVIVYTVLVYALIGLILALGGIALDYAKISMVLERRRSSLLAFFRGLGFVLLNPAKSIGLYLVLALVGLMVFAFYGLLAPGPGQSGNLSVIFAFVIGQIYLLARMMLKLWFLASQTSLFQSQVKPVVSSVPEPPDGRLTIDD